ncbi:MAG: (Fe-S)-binding protein [Candidatus Jordarchaeaceae archaeon]
MSEKQEIYSFFKRDSCTECGDCLVKCPVMQLSPPEAKKEIRRLINSEKTKYVLAKCTTCFSCNIYCPQKADPYELILMRWFDRYRKNGLGQTMKLLSPNHPRNLWSALWKKFPEDEREKIQSWANPQKSDLVIIGGGMTSLVPYITQSKILEDVTFVGTGDFWTSGGLYYQLGLFDVVEQAGRRVEKQLGKLGAKKVIPFYVGEYVMLKRILPQKFGIRFNFQVQPFEEWLLEKIKKGEVKLKSKVKMKVTLHDSCWSKAAGEEFFETVRNLLNTTGVELVEMKHHKENSLCCGFGAGAGRYSMLDIISYAGKRFKEAEETGADALVVHCAGCLWIMSVAKELLGVKMPVYHVFEIVQLAAGEQPLHRHSERAWDIIGTVLAHPIANIVRTGKKYWIAPFPPEIETRTEQLEDKPLLSKLINPLLKRNSVKKLISKTFRIILSLR